MSLSDALPIVFVGPSIAAVSARKILDAEYRPPIGRGGLDGIEPGRVVAIIDGVFGQSLAISPSELRQAAQFGIRIFGSSSMGALRAYEVSEATGVGRVYSMFVEQQIESDDEVAIVFDPETLAALSEPLVNIRHAVERLSRPGTIETDLGERIVAAAQRLFYPQRTYPRILREAGIQDPVVVQQLAAMLRTHDLKREDAVTLLERLTQEPRAAVRSGATFAYRPHAHDALAEVPAASVVAADAPVLFWEYGESIPFRDLVRFLKVTGELPGIASRAVARHLLHGNSLEIDDVDWDPVPAGEAEVVWQRFKWGWWAAEEARVTLRDLGIGFDDLLTRIEEEVTARHRLKALAREESDEFLRALRAELLMSDSLALKLHAIRYGSLLRMAERARPSGPPTAAELSSARNLIAERVDARDWTRALAELAEWGVTANQCDELATLLALARRTGAGVLRDMFRSTAPRRLERSLHRARRRGAPFVTLQRSPKVRGDRRFCLPLEQALEVTTRLRETIGITRVADVTGLSALGISNAQAYRPSGRGSSTVGSGKSTSLVGAKVGAVMEETEKWAQERYDDTVEPDLVSSYELLSTRTRWVIDPMSLDLPYDSRYHPQQPIAWRRCHDLVSDRCWYLPCAALTATRMQDDPLFSPRLARKMFSTNGLASGFTVSEALTHALSELVERHATKLAELQLDNPGGGITAFPFVELASLPPSCARIAHQIQTSGARVSVLDITSEIRVPTFWAMIFTPRDDTLGKFGLANRRASGYGTHPDPEVAISQALLEACQTEVTNIAGAREDLALKSRSLGRHERSRCHSRAGLATLFGSRTDQPRIAFSQVAGFRARDARDEVRFILQRLASAGLPHAFVLDLSCEEIAPVRVVRAIVPGLETTNPLTTGLRPRVSLLRDLMPDL